MKTPQVGRQFSVLGVVFFVAVAQGQPVISGFNPRTGTPGTLVNLAGTNFSSTLASNTVFFGAVQAVVKGATISSLTVVAPTGAIYSPITVSVHGLTAATPVAFQPTFNSGASNITAFSLAPSFNLATGGGPGSAVIADLDGDGRPDIAEVNGDGHTVSIFRKLSTAGSLDANSFAPRVDLALPVGNNGGNPYRLRAADLDGDGKLDLIACEVYGSRVSLFRNLATAENLTTNAFAAPVSLSAGTDCRFATAADLDRDGRTDLVALNYGGNSISLFRNVGAPGSLNANTFAPAVNLPAAGGPYEVAVGDLDGDGKPDLAVANADVSVISVFRNQAVVGSLGTNTFAPRVDVAAQNYGHTIAIGDLDGDGKSDLVVGFVTPNCISVIRNLATPGDFTANSLAAPVNFGLPGWGHTVALSDIDGDRKLDIAVVGELPSYLSLFKNVSTMGSFGAASLAPRVDFSTGWNAWGVAVGDLDGDMRPDVALCNAYDATMSIYRNVVPLSPGVPPTILTNPVSQTVASGTVVTFTVAAVGDEPLSYQWRFNGGNLTGPTSNSFVIVAQQTTLGEYSVVVSNPYGSATSTVARLALTPFPPVITSPPTNLTVYVGTNVTFRVTASGTAPLSYQWRFNGASIIGQTNSTLALKAVQLTNAGNYTVVVTNVAGVVTSSVAVLTVIQPPSCVPPPPGLVSWWRAEKSAADNWGSNNGQAPVGLLTTDGKAGQAFSIGQRYIIVPDAASLRFTNAMTIEAWINPSTVAGNVPQTILSKFDYPSGQLNTSGQSSYLLGLTNNGRVFFTASATGSARTNTMLLTTQVVPTNQWTFVVATYDGTHLRVYLNGSLVASRDYFDGIFPGTDNLGIGVIPYLNSSSYWPFQGLLDEVSLYNRALSAAEILAIYNADVTGKCLAAPSITAQPQDQSIPLGEDVKFTAAVQGSRPLTFQWRFNGAIITGATNATLVLEKVRTNQAGFYHVSATNALGSVVSARAQLTVLPAPSCIAPPEGLISWWPADSSGADAMGANYLSQSSAVTYLTGKVDRAFSFNGTSSFLLVPSSTSLNFGSNADFTIELWVKAGVSNSTYPNVPLVEKRITYRGPIFGYGGGYSLSLHRGRLAFWLGGGEFIAQTARQFISSGPDVRDGMFHHVAVTLARGATNGGKLYVDGAVVLTFDPTFWRGSLANTASFTIGSINSFDTDSRFGGLIDEPAVYGRALSAAEILAIRNAGAAGRCKVRPLIVSHPTGQRITIGSNVTFSATAAGSPALGYQWLRNGALISQATNTTYSFTVQEASVGNYSMLVTNLFGRASSSNVMLRVNHVPIASSANLVWTEDVPAILHLNASDSDKDALVGMILTPPAHGTLTPYIGALPLEYIYTPATNYNGPDSFTYRVSDGLVNSGPATVSLNILPANDPPVAPPQTVALDEDAPTAITLGAFDGDGDPLTYILGAPSHGALSGVAPNLVYLPATNYFGSDSFTYTVSDGQTNSNLGTVSLLVRPVNDAPLANMVVSPLVTNVPGMTNWVIIAAVCDDARVVLDGSASSDVENDLLSYAWLDGTNVIAGGVLATNLLSPGSHEISLQVSDGAAVGSATATVEVISPAQGVGIVIVLLHESDLGRRNIQPLIASLKNAAAAFDQCNAKSGVNQLEAFKHKVRAQIAPADPELAARLIAAVDQILGRVR